ncbi:hypothetical protein BC827DRAFT_1159008 [Russula dissimulans]|nr:hypothetical protein BC827DRAFT_1159008 [Russula dissimulans]
MDERASLLQDNGSVAQQGGVVQGGVVVQRDIGCRPQQALSFYPGRSDDNHPLARIQSRTQESGLNGNDSNAETDEDSGDDSHLAELAQGQPGKISEAMVIERPSWQAMSSNSLCTLPEESSGGTFITDNVDTPLASRSMAPTDTLSQTHTSSLRTSWPAETDLVFKDDKFNLNRQNYFDALLGVAEAHKPETGVIHQRLQCDSKYLAQIMDLPCARIAIFEVKLKGCKESRPQWTRDALGPYRNDRIIAGIYETFFTGGDKSFSKRFNIQFPVSRNQNGEMVCEVPVHIVALVAMVLYAVLKEWQSGTRKSIDFSSSVNLDTYIGHTITLEHIEVTRESGFHVMMGYLCQGKVCPEFVFIFMPLLIISMVSVWCQEPSTIVVANIDYDELEG